MKTVKAARPYATGALLLALVALISSITLRAVPSQASHGDPVTVTLTLNSPSENTLGQVTVNQGNDVPFVFLLSAPPTGTALILVEIMGGANDPDGEDTIATPDYWCTIAAAASPPSCPVNIDFPFSAAGSGNGSIRAAVNAHTIDTLEGSSSTGLGSTPGCKDEPDTTEVTSFIVNGGVGGTTPTAGPPPAGVNVAYNCDNIEPTGSPSPTVTTSPSPSGSTSPSPSGSTSPSPSGSTSPSPSGSTSPSPTPTTGTGTITIAVTPTLGTYGVDPKVTGVLKCNGTPVPNAEVIVAFAYTRNPPPVFFLATNTAADGTYEVFLTDLPASSEVLAFWDGNTTCADGAITDDVVVVRIRPGILSNADKPQGSPSGTLITFNGQVLPAHPGKKATLMLFDGGNTRTWKPLFSVDLTGSDSRFRMQYRKRSSSVLHFRIAYMTQDSDHLWNWGRVFQI